MARFDNRVLNWAEEENEIDNRHDNRAPPGARSGNFWRSVWKGIESSNVPAESPAPMQEMSLEPPRDYVVEADNRTQARPI